VGFWAKMLWQRTTFVITPEVRVNLDPIWGQIFWFILGLTLARALVDLYCFVRRGWTRGRSWSRLALDVAGSILALITLRAGHWAEMVVANVSPAEAAKLGSAINSMIRLSLIVGAIVPVFDVVKQIRLLYGAREARDFPSGHGRQQAAASGPMKS